MAKEKDDGKALHPVDIACVENVSELTLESWSESAFVLTVSWRTRAEWLATQATVDHS